MKGKKSSLITLTFLATGCGIALACSQLAMPPIPAIPVSLADLRKFTDRTNPAHAAFLRKLDTSASRLVGEEQWKNNAYYGYVSYTVKILHMTGRAAVYMEKPCGETAEKAGIPIMEHPPGHQGGGSAGGGSQGGSGGPLIGGGCYGSCGGSIPIVDVGDIQQM